MQIAIIDVSGRVGSHVCGGRCPLAYDLKTVKKNGIEND
jgi:hypothetical protein